MHSITHSAFLTRTLSHKKLFVKKNEINSKLPKSQSFTNLGKKYEQNDKNIQNSKYQLPKKSLNQLLDKNKVNSIIPLKKPLRSIQNVNYSNKSIYTEGQKINKQNLEQNEQKQIFNSLDTNIQPAIQFKPKKQKSFFKKRRIRNTNAIQKSQNNKISQKSTPLNRKQSLNHNQILSSSKYWKKNQKEEQYYIDQLKKQLQKINQHQQQDAIPPMIIGHFFQSISTFYRFQHISMPDASHLSIFIPKQKRHKTTLIFDMDQTLIHAEPYRQQIHANSWGTNFEVLIDDGSKVLINLKIRPFVLEVLQRLKNKFQIAIFTAANQNYARQILKKLDPSNKIFDFFLFRQHCHVVEGKLAIKDLRILTNRCLKNAILIDNSPHTYLYQPQNALPIISFYHDQNDNEILKLQKYLNSQKFQKKQDVRPLLKNKFQFHRYTEFQDIQQMVQILYGKTA